MADSATITEPETSDPALTAARKLIAEYEATAAAAADAKLAAAEEAAAELKGKVPVSSFGRRTDAHQGMQLGLAPGGLSAAGLSSDESAPVGLSDLSTGMVVPTTVQPGPPPPKPELPFNRMIREASEAVAAQADADRVAALALSAKMNSAPGMSDAEKDALIAQERLRAAQELAHQAEQRAQAERDEAEQRQVVADGVREKLGMTEADLSSPRESEPDPEYVPTQAEINEQLLADTRATLAQGDASAAEVE